MKLHLRLALPLFAVAVAVTVVGTLGAFVLINRTFGLALAVQERQARKVIENAMAGKRAELDAQATVMAILDGDTKTRLAAWKHPPLDSAGIFDAKTGRTISDSGDALDRTDLSALPASLQTIPLLMRGAGGLYLASVKPDRNRPGHLVLAAFKVKPAFVVALKGLLQGDVTVSLGGGEILSTATGKPPSGLALSVPFMTPGGGRAVFRAFVGMEDIQRERRNALALVVAGGTVLLFAGLLFYNWTLSRVTRPIRELAAAADRIAGGEAGVRLPAGAPGELGELVNRFNDMAGKLREAQGKLVHSAKLSTVGQMVAGISHELNNPLAGLITHAEVQSALLPAGSPGRTELDVILREAQRMKRILADLRDMSRPGTAQRTRTDLNAITRDVVALLRHQCQAARVEAETSLAVGELAVMGAPDQLRQIILNLALNALEAMPDGGKMTVSTSRDGATARLSVVDTGKGVSGENGGRIMEPFFTTKPGRMGLGLAISREIAVKHGGKLGLENRRGGGAVAKLELPAAP